MKEKEKRKKKAFYVNKEEEKIITNAAERSSESVSVFVRKSALIRAKIGGDSLED